MRARLWPLADAVVGAARVAAASYGRMKAGGWAERGSDSQLLIFSLCDFLHILARASLLPCYTYLSYSPGRARRRSVLVEAPFGRRRDEERAVPGLRQVRREDANNRRHHTLLQRFHKGRGRGCGAQRRGGA